VHQPKAERRDFIGVSTTPVPPASVAIVGTWKLLRLESHPELPPLTTTPELVFDEAGRVTGSTGCNQLFGAYQISGKLLHGPLVILLDEQGADEAGDGILVGEDADHFGAPFDLADGGPLPRR
jgi:hypothetical protein